MRKVKSSVFVAVAALSLLLAPAALACHTADHAKNFKILHTGTFQLFNSVNPTKVYNYDFASASCPRSNNVEWPIDLVFINNASMPTINNALGGNFFPYSHPFTSNAWGRIDDGNDTGFHFWSDGGRKTAAGSPGTSDVHYRLYALNHNRSYNREFGYYVFGTLHHDYNEAAGITNPTYGYSETAERTVTNDVVGLRSLGYNWQAFRDAINMQNAEPFRVEGDHIWKNNGLATEVVIH